MSDLSNKKEAKRVSRAEFIRLLAPLAGGALLAACGVKQAGGTQKTASAENSHLIKIATKEGAVSYEPAVINIKAGEEVTWQNISIYPQSATCDPGQAADAAMVSLPNSAKPWDSGVLYPGQKWSYTFKVPGDYLYFSRYPVEAIPVGLVRVS